MRNCTAKQRALYTDNHPYPSFPPLPLPPLLPASHSLAFHYERLLRERRHPERAERVEGSLPSAPCATARQSSALCRRTITRTPPFLHFLCLPCLQLPTRSPSTRSDSSASAVILSERSESKDLYLPRHAQLHGKAARSVHRQSPAPLPPPAAPPTLTSRFPLARLPLGATPPPAPSS